MDQFSWCETNSPKEWWSQESDWRRDEEGWWSLQSDERKVFEIKFTEEGDEKLFKFSHEDSEWETNHQLLSVLQYATHIYSESDNGQMADIAEVLLTADNSFSSLESLRITAITKGNLVTRSVLEAMKSRKLSRLNFVQLHEVGLEATDLEILAGAIESGCLPCLKHLYLNNHKFRSGHSALARAMESGQMLALETLSLSESGMRDDGCEAYATALSLGKLPSLIYLTFEGNKIRNRGAEALERAIQSGELKNLAELDLGSNPIGSGHVALARAMESGQLLALERLKLSETAMGNTGCFLYATALSSGKAPSLTHINFRSNGIGSGGAEALGRAIQSGSLKNMVEIDLVGNPIGSGHFALARAMESSQVALALERLCLDKTEMGDIECEAYANATSSGKLPSLMTFSVARNKIGNKGAEALGVAIQSGELTSLVFLDLGENVIRNDGMIALADAFQVGMGLPNLRLLNACDNETTEEAVQELEDALKSGRLVIPLNAMIFMDPQRFGGVGPVVLKAPSKLTSPELQRGKGKGVYLE